MPQDFLEAKRTEIRDRLKELKPLHDEYLKLEQALAALEGVTREGNRRGPGRPPGKRASGPTRRRRRRGGTRADQAAQIIAAKPGITVSEIASEMNIKPNYVYRVMHELNKDNRIRKEGRGYVAA